MIVAAFKVEPSSFGLKSSFPVGVPVGYSGFHLSPNGFEMLQASNELGTPLTLVKSQIEGEVLESMDLFTLFKDCAYVTPYAINFLLAPSWTFVKMTEIAKNLRANAGEFLAADKLKLSMERYLAEAFKICVGEGRTNKQYDGLRLAFRYTYTRMLGRLLTTGKVEFNHEVLFDLDELKTIEALCNNSASMDTVIRMNNDMVSWAQTVHPTSKQKFNKQLLSSQIIKAYASQSPD
jgi:hypothetical protein